MNPLKHPYTNMQPANTKGINHVLSSINKKTIPNTKNIITNPIIILIPPSLYFQHTATTKQIIISELPTS